jgi:uncharacterized protein (TIGR02611 family)
MAMSTTTGTIGMTIAATAMARAAASATSPPTSQGAHESTRSPEAQEARQARETNRSSAGASRFPIESDGAVRYDEPSTEVRRSSGVNWRAVWIWTRKIVILVVGLALLIAGLGMLVLPGPGVVTILLGLGLLATEFPWARKILRQLRDWARQALELMRRTWRRVRDKVRGMLAH